MFSILATLNPDKQSTTCVSLVLNCASIKFTGTCEQSRLNSIHFTQMPEVMKKLQRIHLELFRKTKIVSNHNTNRQL